jgi:hypothetical protein
MQEERFTLDKKKVMLAISRLKGTAGLSIRPYLEMPENAKPAFFGDFSLFVSAMKDQ